MVKKQWTDEEGNVHEEEVSEDYDYSENAEMDYDEPATPSYEQNYKPPKTSSYNKVPYNYSEEANNPELGQKMRDPSTINPNARPPPGTFSRAQRSTMSSNKHPYSSATPSAPRTPSISTGGEYAQPGKKRHMRLDAHQNLDLDTSGVRKPARNEVQSIKKSRISGPEAPSRKAPTLLRTAYVNHNTFGTHPNYQLHKGNKETGLSNSNAESFKHGPRTPLVSESERSGFSDKRALRSARETFTKGGRTPLPAWEGPTFEQRRQFTGEHGPEKGANPPEAPKGGGGPMRRRRFEGIAQATEPYGREMVVHPTANTPPAPKVRGNANQAPNHPPIALPAHNKDTTMTEYKPGQVAPVKKPANMTTGEYRDIKSGKMSMKQFKELRKMDMQTHIKLKDMAQFQQTERLKEKELKTKQQIAQEKLNELRKMNNPATSTTTRIDRTRDWQKAHVDPQTGEWVGLRGGTEGEEEAAAKAEALTQVTREAMKEGQKAILENLELKKNQGPSGNAKFDREYDLLQKKWQREDKIRAEKKQEKKDERKWKKKHMYLGGYGRFAGGLSAPAKKRGGGSAGGGGSSGGGGPSQGGPPNRPPPPRPQPSKRPPPRAAPKKAASKSKPKTKSKPKAKPKPKGGNKKK